VFAFRLLHYLFEYVLNSQAGTQKANSIAVHQLEQVAAGPIDASDAFQVNFDLSARLIRTGNLPAVFELGHIDPGYPPLDLEYQLIVDFFHLNFHHWFTDIAAFRGRRHLKRGSRTVGRAALAPIAKPAI
jgi:hypothetical protein